MHWTQVHQAHCLLATQISQEPQSLLVACQFFVNMILTYFWPVFQPLRLFYRSTIFSCFNWAWVWESKSAIQLIKSTSNISISISWLRSHSWSGSWWHPYSSRRSLGAWSTSLQYEQHTQLLLHSTLFFHSFQFTFNNY